MECRIKNKTNKMSYLLQPQWIKVTKSYTDFATAALTNDIEIYSLPAKGVVHAVVMHHTTPFTGGLIATYTISVGTSGAFAKYIVAGNVLQAAGNTVTFPAVASAPVSAVSPENMGTTTSIRAQAISTVGNLNAATGGSIDFYLLTAQLP